MIRVMRPFGHLFTRGVVAALILTVPLFIVFYWLTASNGRWPVVALIQLGFLLLVGVGVLAYFTTTIQLDLAGVRERGFFGRVTKVERSQVGSILIVDVYESHTLDARPQLFVIDERGSMLLRMRGQFWAKEQMEQVADHLEVIAEMPPGPVTLAELRSTRPGLLYWFERFPRVRNAQASGPPSTGSQE